MQVMHKHTSSCYTDTRCGGSCEKIEYNLEGCECSMSIPCDDHDCYWEDPSDFYPSGCWHCYCPKGSTWRCTKCGKKSSSERCSNGELAITCGKTGAKVASVLLEKSTGDWCRELELRAEVELTGAELTETPYIWDGVCSDQNSYLVTENGVHTFELQADSNSDTASAKIEIQVNNIDRTPPQILSYRQEPADGWTREPVKLLLSEISDLQPDGSAGCGLAELPVKFEDGEWTDERIFTVSDSGTYVVWLQDMLGNTGEVSVQVQWLDVTGPAVDVFWDQTPNLTQVTVQVSAQDLQKDGSSGSGLAAYPYSYDNGVTWTDETSFEVYENGSYPVWVKDKLGNVTELFAEINTLDTTGPVVNILVSPEEWSGEGSVTLEVEATDEGSGLAALPYSWDQGETFTDEAVRVVDTEGTYQVLVKDQNGNVTVCEVTVAKKKAENIGNREEHSSPGKDGNQKQEWEGAETPSEDAGPDNTNSSGEELNGAGNSGAVKEEVIIPEPEVLPLLPEEVFQEQTTNVKKNKEAGKVLTSLGQQESEVIPEEEENGESEQEETQQMICEDETSAVKETTKQKEVKADMALTDRESSGSLRHMIKENPVAAAAVTVSAALLICVTGMILFLLFMGIRVYHEDENRKYRLLGMRLCKHSAEGLRIRIPDSMTEKDASGKFRLVPGWLFVLMHNDEEMLVESLESGEICSVKISKNMDFRL